MAFLSDLLLICSPYLLGFFRLSHCNRSGFSCVSILIQLTTKRRMTSRITIIVSSESCQGVVRKPKTTILKRPPYTMLPAIRILNFWSIYHQLLGQLLNTAISVLLGTCATNQSRCGTHLTYAWRNWKLSRKIGSTSAMQCNHKPTAGKQWAYYSDYTWQVYVGKTEECRCKYCL